jgi:hypothetical protein
LRWFDDVREDIRILKVKDWRSTAMDRDDWRLLVQEEKFMANNRKKRFPLLGNAR